MAEYSANALQTINPGETVVFTIDEEPCNRGFILHRSGTGNFLLSGKSARRTCCPCKQRSAKYLVNFGANIAIPAGGTIGSISVALALDGVTIPATTMIETPTAVEEFNNVSVAKDVDIWFGCCETLSVRNTSDQPILMQNANILINRSDLAVTY